MSGVYLQKSLELFSENLFKSLTDEYIIYCGKNILRKHQVLLA